LKSADTAARWLCHHAPRNIRIGRWLINFWFATRPEIAFQRIPDPHCTRCFGQGVLVPYDDEQICPCAEPRHACLPLLPRWLWPDPLGWKATPPF
jgi:hypothetical protein